MGSNSLAGGTSTPKAALPAKKINPALVVREGSNPFRGAKFSTNPNTNMEAIHTEQIGRLTLSVFPDEFGITDPRETGTVLLNIYHWHRIYDNLGEQVDPSEFDSMEALVKAHSSEGDHVFPLYIYDHSGVSLSLRRTYPFTDRWDAGQVGFVVLPKAKYESETPDQDPFTVAEREVRWFAKYISGEAYYYDVTDERGIYVDSCSGFDDYDYCLSTGRAAAACELELDKQAAEFERNTFAL